MPFNQEVLKAARTERGMSRARLAALSGVSYAYIQQLETGHRSKPGTDKLRGIATALGMNLDDFFANEPSRQPKQTDKLSDRQVLEGEINQILATLSTQRLITARDLLIALRQSQDSEVESV